MQPAEELFTRQLPGDRYRDQTDPVLQLDAINVSFDGFQALTDLSLNIGVGELRCVIGPNGAGKTTLMDVITGKTRPKSGKAIYDQSIDLTTLEPAAIARQGIGRKFQKPTVFEALTVWENLEIAMKTDKSVWASLRAKLNGEQVVRIDEMLVLLRLSSERDRRAGLLSHGQKQFLEIGMLLVQDPHLLYSMKQGNHVERYQQPANLPQVGDPKSPYWGIVRNGMYGMANQPNGTGYKLFHTAPYQIAAKSGTSQVFSLKENQTYNAKMIPVRLRDHIFYTLFAPYQHPKVAMALILENGGGDGVVAGPTARAILDHIFVPQQASSAAADVPQRDSADAQ